MATKLVLSERSATKTKLAVEGCEFERAFRVQYILVNSGFSEILELKPSLNLFRNFIKHEDAFMVLPTGCGKSLIFQPEPKVCLYLHDRIFIIQKLPSESLFVP